MSKRRIPTTDKNGKQTHVWVGSDKDATTNRILPSMSSNSPQKQMSLRKDAAQSIVASGTYFDRTFKHLWREYDRDMMNAETIEYQEGSNARGNRTEVEEPTWVDAIMLASNPTDKEASDIFGGNEEAKDRLYQDLAKVIESGDWVDPAKASSTVLPRAFSPMPPFALDMELMLEDREVHRQYARAFGVDPEGMDDSQYGASYLYCDSHRTVHPAGTCIVSNRLKSPIFVDENDPNVITLAHVYAEDAGFDMR